MKEIYLDIMEKSLSAYTDSGIREYIAEVKREGLKEHGFPRLGVNIGILIAYGRRTELLPVFVEIMDICCDQMPRKKAANDFSIREVCCCLMLLEERAVVGKALLEKWKAQLAAFDPWKFYSIIDRYDGAFVSNWAMFSAVSEFMRGVYCGLDTTGFVEAQLPSQLANLDENDMYQDDPPYSNHAVYDLVPRFLMAFLLRAGYKGKYAARLEQVLDNTAELTLKMQSVTGELAFGGRSNQFLNNEPMLSSYCEMEAARFAEKGDMEMAGRFKAAALLAAEATLRYLNLKPIGHVKNRYDIATKYGCEGYGYFNKYMITVASNVYMGFLFADDSVVPTVAPAQKGGYVIRTSEHFHRTFLSAGGYHLELDTNADPHYDANGLGRIHKAGVPSALCLTVPFPGEHPSYGLEAPNRGPMAICSAVGDLVGAEKPYLLRHAEATAEEGNVSFEVTLSPEITLTEDYHVTENGMEISLSGHPEVEYCIPVFEFDGCFATDIEQSDHAITVTYQGGRCSWQTQGTIPEEYGYYYNRNGRYRLYRVKGQKFRVTLDVLSK